MNDLVTRGRYPGNSVSIATAGRYYKPFEIIYNYVCDKIQLSYNASKKSFNYISNKIQLRYDSKKY